MRAFRLIASLGLTGLSFPPVRAAEDNFWPIAVVQTGVEKTDADRVVAWQGGGPLFFGTVHGDGSSAEGFRPFYVRQTDATGRTVETDFLYPLLTHRENATDHRWSLFSLVNHEAPWEATAAGNRSFDIWPIYFSRHTGDPATSYRAVFPLQGTVINHFGDDRISWTLFPLYGRFERNGVTTTTVPWPVIKILKGDGNHGFAVWTKLYSATPNSRAVAQASSTAAKPCCLARERTPKMRLTASSPCRWWSCRQSCPMRSPAF